MHETDGNTLKRTRHSEKSHAEKVLNLLTSILETVGLNVDRQPYAISVGERPALIAELYKQRQKSTQETLEILKKIIEEINSARKQQAGKKMRPEVFSIFWLLKKEGVGSPDGHANRMREAVEKHPHWRTSERHERNVRQSLYRNLVQSGISDTDRHTEICSKVMRILKGGRA